MTFRTLDADTVPDRLIRAGLAILASDGMPGLTLRRIAARAGVSHAAPAHHFDGLQGLNAAIAAHGFRMLTSDLQALDRATCAEPFDWLACTQEAYLDFAARHPDLFRLMLTAPLPEDEALHETILEAHAIYLEACTRVTGAERAHTVLMAIWAMTHGYAMLQMSEPHHRFPFPFLPYRAMLAMLVRPDPA